MKSEDPRKEPITPAVLLRYKLLILTVASLVILGGYVRIITQPRRFSATARMKVRFSSEVFNLPELTGASNVRVPLLEEEVKAYMVQLRDPGFIDLALSDLDALANTATDENDGSGGAHDDGEVEEVLPEEPSALETLGERGKEMYNEVRRTVTSLLDSILFVKDTIVSARERRVLQVLGGLAIEAGTDASHLINVTFTDKDPERAARIANLIAFKFIELQKAKTRRRDIKKLEQAVEKASEELQRVIRERYELSAELGHVSLDAAIAQKFDRVETLKRENELIASALDLLSDGIVPTDRQLPVGQGRAQDLDRVFYERLVMTWDKIAQAPENAAHFETMLENLRTAKELDEARTKSEMQRELENRLKVNNREIETLLRDTSVVERSPAYSSLLVEETTAQARLQQAENELLEGQKFNEQLEAEHVAEYISLWQAANPPPFPDQQRRLLKLIVSIILGFVAGCGMALARHLIWPKAPRPAYETDPAFELDVPIVILPEDDDQTLESDLEFDMTFPEDEESRPRKESRR